MGRRRTTISNEVLDAYIHEMEIMYAEQKELQRLYWEDVMPDPYFDYSYSVKVTRMWEVIISMEDIVSRNLLLLFHACGCRYKDTLEALGRSDKRVAYKNEATLRVMVCNSRKEVRRLYREKYGEK